MCLKGDYWQFRCKYKRTEEEVEDEVEVEDTDNPTCRSLSSKQSYPVEQTGDTFDEWNHKGTQREHGAYINQIPLQGGKRVSGTPARTARDVDPHNLGPCRSCGSIIPWSGKCEECGHQILTKKIVRCLDSKPPLLINGADCGLYVPFNQADFDQQCKDRIAALKKYYAENPNAEDVPEKGRVIGYRKHERLTLPDPKIRMEKNQVKLLQIFRVLAKMVADHESNGRAPRDIIKEVRENYQSRNKFIDLFYKWYLEPFGMKKMKSDDVIGKMDMAEGHIKKIEKRNRQQEARRTDGYNLSRFIKK